MSRTGYHDPVLLQEVLAAMPEQASFVLDGTLGHGGHTAALLEQWKISNPNGVVIATDRDASMLAKAKERLAPFGDRCRPLLTHYADFPQVMQSTGGQLFAAILLDIGVNMEHFKDGERGFSIKKDGPLDMRFDTISGVSAQQRLAQATKEQFIAMLESYTDFSPKRVEHITKSRFLSSRQFATTKALSEWAKSIGMNEKSLAVLFQAIRIVVNDELDLFADFLAQFIDYLAPGGKCIILTYHSIEDRMAKNAFKALEEEGKATIVTKHVIQPTRKEKERNPAARSAKMRVLVKM